jgi:hypothetical protein
MMIDVLKDMAICSKCKLNILQAQGYKINMLLPNGQEICLWLCWHCLPLPLWERVEELKEEGLEL